MLRLELRRQLGRVGDVLVGVRRGESDAQVLGDASRVVRRHELSALKRSHGVAELQHARVSGELRGQLGRLG